MENQFDNMTLDDLLDALWKRAEDVGAAGGDPGTDEDVQEVEDIRAEIHRRFGVR